MNNSLQAYRNIKKDLALPFTLPRPIDIKLFPFSLESSKPCFLRRVTKEREIDLQRIKQRLELNGFFVSLYQDSVKKTPVIVVSLLDGSGDGLEEMGFMPFDKSEYYVHKPTNIYIEVDRRAQLDRFYNENQRYIKPVFEKYGDFECFKTKGALGLKGSGGFVESVVRAKHSSVMIKYGRYFYTNFTQEVAEHAIVSYSSEEEEEEEEIDSNRSFVPLLTENISEDDDLVKTDPINLLKSADTEDTTELIKRIDKEINSDHMDSILLSDSDADAETSPEPGIERLTKGPYTKSIYFRDSKFTRKFGKFQPLKIINQEYDVDHHFTINDIESPFVLITPISDELIQTETHMRQLSHDLVQRFQKFGSGRISNVSINRNSGLILLEMGNKKSVLELIKCIHGVVYKNHYAFYTSLCDLEIGKELYRNCEWNCSSTELTELDYQLVE